MAARRARFHALVCTSRGSEIADERGGHRIMALRRNNIAAFGSIGFFRD
jgi:hypothetical protein